MENPALDADFRTPQGNAGFRSRQCDATLIVKGLMDNPLVPCIVPGNRFTAYDNPWSKQL